MGEVLFELEQVLRSRQGKLTPQEAHIFQTCKSKAVREFTFGLLAGACAGWAATWKFRTFARINLSGGAAAFTGLWSFSRSLDSCVDHVLTLDGSRMQEELANIMVTKYRNDPLKMRLISKHFYSEKVFDDSDQPKLRWRYRNFFSDDVTHGQRTHEGDSPSNSHGDSHKDSHTDAHNKIHGDSRNDSDNQRNYPVPKQVRRNPGSDMMADPFDCVFGDLARREEIHLPDASTTLPRTPPRGHKRSHRRRRMHHQNGLSNAHHL